MKAFTERNPVALGAIGLAILAALVAAVLFLNRSVFTSGYTVYARFANAAGVAKGTQVLEAGVPVGSVRAVTIDGNAVVATLDVDDGVVLPHDTAAAVQVQTLLGVLDVSLQPIGGWSKPLRSGALLTDTSVPTELYQVQNEAGNLLEHTDVRALNNLVHSLAAITAGKRQQVQQIIDGLGALTQTVNARSGEVSQLIDSANQLSSALAGRSNQLATLITNLNTVASGLAGHSSELASLIDNLDALGAQTNSLTAADHTQLNGLLSGLHTDLSVVGKHQVDLAETVSYLASAIKGFSSIGYSGPDDTPNSWGNIYTNLVTAAGGYGVLGPCGALDIALDQVLGPDPLPCDQRNGPLPPTSGGTAAPTASTAPTSPSASPSASPSTSSTPASSSGSSAPPTAGLPAGSSSGTSGLSQVLQPLLGDGP